MAWVTPARQRPQRRSVFALGERRLFGRRASASTVSNGSSRVRWPWLQSSSGQRALKTPRRTRDVGLFVRFRLGLFAEGRGLQPWQRTRLLPVRDGAGTRAAAEGDDVRPERTPPPLWRCRAGVTQAMKALREGERGPSFPWRNWGDRGERPARRRRRILVFRPAVCEQPTTPRDRRPAAMLPVSGGPGRRGDSHHARRSRPARPPEERAVRRQALSKGGQIVEVARHTPERRFVLDAGGRRRRAVAAPPRLPGLPRRQRPGAVAGIPAAAARRGQRRMVGQRPRSGGRAVRPRRAEQGPVVE